MKIFDRIDEVLESKPLKEVILIYLMIVGVIGFIMIYFILDFTLSFQQQMKNENQKLSIKLVTTNTRKISLNAEAIKLVKEINDLISKRDMLKKDKEYYEELANLINFVKFDRFKWGQFVKHIALDTVNYSLIVKSINNYIFNDVNSTRSINKRMELELTLNGDYKNFIKFIYNYENRRDLIRVEKLSILDKNNFIVKFAMYGYDK